MQFSIIIPHFKSKITAYVIYKLIDLSKKHELQIIIVDNSCDESIKYLKPFKDFIKYVPYPKDRLQSHGIAIDYALEKGYVHNEYFIAIESDAFPTKDYWLNYYENLIENGFQSAGSLLGLSGGTYVHPCGALYSKSIWRKAKKYCDDIEYGYFPNMSMREGFACHTMIHKSILNEVILKLDDYIEPSDAYKDLHPYAILKRLTDYYPTVCPFHNGMGANNESIRTYGFRNPESESKNIILDNKRKIIKRIGYEPGQWLHYFMLASGVKIFEIPTEIKWLSNRENEQQEYTLNEAGILHAWAGSSFLDMKDTPMHDVYEFKNNQIEELYNSLPKNFKI